ncbi:arylsulfatase [Sphingobium tyrosinilyticum]|uniref:Arylsulfatase n=1 Tax=Sphingobium tyrosinilyticum TaxID=2715436 RepID=A0ABV9F6Z6_9SPHN
MRRLLFALSAATMLADAATAPARPAFIKPVQRPNILLIVLDDVGYSDFGSYGSEIRTPAIDALAKGGLRYNRFDTRAVCSATRAALLTGRNNQSVGMESLASVRNRRDPANTATDRGEMPANAETMAQALSRAGYATYAVGKWHLAPDYDAPPKGPAASWPLQRGFQSYYGFIGGWTDQYKPTLVEGNAPVPTPARAGYHLSEDLVDHAIAAFDKKPNDKPAFVYLAFGAGHSPIQVPRRYIDSYAGVYERGWDVLREERFARQKKMGLVPHGTQLSPRNAGDAAWNSLDPVRRRVFARFMATYAGFITHTDEQIGRLIDHLKASGALDNTLVMVISDNGAASEAQPDGAFRVPYGDRTTVEQMDASLDELGGPTTQALYQRPWAMLGSTPFPRYKLWPNAGGIRAPLVVSWKGHLASPGGIRTQRVDAIDLAPTLLEAAGTRFSASIAGVKQLPVAGRSISATFRSPKAPGRRSQFFGLYANRAIYSGMWEAVAMRPCGGDISTERWQLFDSSRDFAQARDVAAINPAVLKRLKRLWQQQVDTWVGQPLAGQQPIAVCKYMRMGDAFASQGD